MKRTPPRAYEAPLGKSPFSSLHKEHRLQHLKRPERCETEDRDNLPTDQNTFLHHKTREAGKHPKRPQGRRLPDYPCCRLGRHYLNQLLSFLEGFMEVRKGISALCFQNLQPFLQLLDFLFTLVPGLFGNSSKTVSAWLSRPSYTLEQLT